MSTERATREITLKDGAVVVLYDYITGREKRAIESVYLNEAKISQKSKDIEISGISGSINHAMLDAALKTVVKEIKPAEGNAITERKPVLDYILDLPESEYDKVIKSVNEITDPKKAEATS